MKPNIALNDVAREGVSTLLNVLLSDEYVLYTKTRNYHWNVKGPQFPELHKFYEAQYDTLGTIVDEVAERSLMLGQRSFGTITEFMKHTRLKENATEAPNAKEMTANLLADHESIVRSLRVDLDTCMTKHHDAGTCDFLTGLMEQHEKMAWMLRSFLHG